MERIDCDEDVSHIRVNLISSIATLKLLCDRVLKKESDRRDSHNRHGILPEQINTYIIVRIIF